MKSKSHTQMMLLKKQTMYNIEENNYEESHEENNYEENHQQSNIEEINPFDEMDDSIYDELQENYRLFILHHHGGTGKTSICDINGSLDYINNDATIHSRFDFVTFSKSTAKPNIKVQIKKIKKPHLFVLITFFWFFIYKFILVHFIQPSENA